MDTLRHGLNGYRIPAYIEEILTHNYCPCFVRMTMIREEESYRFSYRPGRLIRLKVSSLDTYDRLVLLRSLISVNETAQSYLIGAENYLLEPELIYTSGDSLAAGSLKILFYPDVKRLGFSRKLMLFAERIKDESSREEREILGQFRDVIEGDDINKARMFLDKNILRIESRSMNKAG